MAAVINLKVQQAISWMIVLIGVSVLPIGFMRPAFWWVALGGLALAAISLCVARHIGRELRTIDKARRLRVEETVFRETVARTGRLDLAREEVKKTREQRRLIGRHRRVSENTDRPDGRLAAG